MDFEENLQFAQKLDKADPLKDFRNEFYFPQHNGKGCIYFCGNSLGLQPKKVEEFIRRELRDWRELAIDGYLKAENPWLYYQNNFSGSLSKMVGCKPDELTVMNTLTVDLHLLLFSFYHPDSVRYKIIMEAGAFPSDQYAVETQVRFHSGIQKNLFNADDAIIEIAPPAGEKLIREKDIIDAIYKNGSSLSLVLLGGINYYTGQLFNMQHITSAAHEVNAFAGFDLAHAAGNVPLFLHDWGVDFACWCSYKYLNSGPGAVAGVYINEKFAAQQEHIRMGGWWGNDEKTRFKMEKGFVPKPSASGWNISTAQVFNMVALMASLEQFDRAGFRQLCIKSQDLTSYLEFLLKKLDNIGFEIITPSSPTERGAQLSLYFPQKGKEVHRRMLDAGIVVDYREPGVIRVAPAPMYNSFEDVFAFYSILKTF